MLVDLSHTISDGLVTYKGLPAPIICDYLSREASRDLYADGVEFHIGRIDMVANTGTYLDSPFHRYADGIDVAGLRLEAVADVPAVTVRAPDVSIGETAFDGIDVRGKAVLVHTGWDRNWGSDEYFERHPHLTEGAAQWLVERGASLVGIDSHNIDDTSDMRRPVHSILLGAGTLIVEHMTGLGALPAADFRFFAVPVKVRGFGTFPVRAFALIPDGTESSRDR